MAVADAKMTGRPGVVLVSRGPGACNAAIAVHTAEQDAGPLILLVGQVEKRDLRRNAFQEIDYARMFVCCMAPPRLSTPCRHASRSTAAFTARMKAAF
jgi:thiamine pyrophosphate-dependent acetolactate synthase large subunit-like protein